MRIIRKIGIARHFIAISLLAFMLSIFSASAGKATAQSKRKVFDDPVMSVMTWENSSDSDEFVNPTDINPGCPVNCNPGCVVNCDSACDGNCQNSSCPNTTC